VSNLRKMIFRSLASCVALLTCVAFSASQTPTNQPATNQSNTTQQQNAPAGNPAPQSGQSSPVETIKARAQVVLLDVVANDRQGQPVTDLKQSDFTIKEQGQPQQLASFKLVDTTKPARPAGPPPKLPPGVFTNHPQAIADEGQLIVLLLDALNTPWADQVYARQQMLKYLQKNHEPGQRMAIYGLTSRVIRLQDFTTDPEILARVIRREKGSTSPLIDGANDAQTIIDDRMSESAVAALGAFEEDVASAQMDMRVRLTLDALKAIARQLSGYAGRKKLIWVSGSFPVNLEPGENSGFSSQRTYGDDITATTSLLRDSQVSVYPIDPSGLVGFKVFEASQPSMGRNGRGATGQQISSAMSSQLARQAAAHYSAQQVAQQTGGLAFYNKNDLDNAIMRSVKDGTTYYALSYAPTNKQYDGKLRHIDVRVNRPGLELRYRKSYYAIDPEKVSGNSRVAAMQEIGPAINTVLTSSAVTFYASALELKASAKTGEAAPSAAPKLADIRFLVEPRDLMFQPNGEKKHCNVEFVAAAFVGDKQIKTTDKQLECDVEPARFEQMQRDGMLFRMTAEVPEGQSRIRLLVRDNLSGKLGTVDLPYGSGTAAAK
jgi:VWFA-related protein